MSEWKNTTWGDVISLEYGKSLKNYREGVGNIRVYGSNGPIGWSESKLSEGPGLILGRKGAYRGIEYSKGDFWVIDTAYYAKPKIDVDLKWLYYAMKGYKLGEINDGSPIPSTPRAFVYNELLNLPPLPEQKAIAKILGDLDDKIELNRQLNQTLEEMAQALFQSWFVDFDPVLDNAIAAGNETPEVLQVKTAKRSLVSEDKKLLNVNPGLAKLFPNSFVFNEELEKWIPEGWEVKKLEQLVKHQKGYAFKSSWYQEEGHIVVRVSDTTESSIDVNSCNKISDELALEYSSYALEENDLVIATVGSWPPNYSSVVGKVIRVPRTAVGGLLNQNAVKLTVSDEYLFHQGFLHFNLKNSRFMDYITNRAQGSANQASITLKSIFNYTVLLANDGVMNAFSQQVAKSFDKQNLNQKHTETLTKLRDILLPQLISGKLRVPEAMLQIEKEIN